MQTFAPTLPPLHLAAPPLAKVIGLVAAPEVLPLRLGGRVYAVELRQVLEIRSYEPPVPVSHAPGWITGVIQLRGVIVPVLDLRLTLGAGHAADDGHAVLVLLDVRARCVGVVVDAVGAVRPALQQGLTGLTDHDRALTRLDIEGLMQGMGPAWVND